MIDVVFHDADAREFVIRIDRPRPRNRMEMRHAEILALAKLGQHVSQGSAAPTGDLTLSTIIPVDDLEPLDWLAVARRILADPYRRN